MDLKFIFFIIVWLLANTRRQLLFNYWWQIKEYRTDRFFHFAKTGQGINHLEIPLFLMKLVLFFYIYFFKNQSAYNLFTALITWEVFLFIKETANHQIRKSNLSVRGKNFRITSLFFILVSCFFLHLSRSYQVLISLDIISYTIPFISLAWTSIFYEKTLKKEKEIAKKVLSHSKTKIIGITGSYGKTSTKHLIYQIISKHYKTVETPKSHNTIFSIIRTINSSIKKNTEFFICEMGAYKKNEIKELSQIAPPDIAIITGISPQHLALFGSIENLIKTKYELVESLKSKKSPVFINTTSPSTKPILKLAKEESRPVFTYSLNPKKQTDYSIKIVSQKKSLSKIEFTTPQKKYFYVTSIKTTHFIENLTVALSIAHYLKIPNKRIESALKNFNFFSETLHLKKLSPRLNLIDDSYSSNPQGFIAAINELFKLSPRFKMVVTSGIVELGNQKHIVHQKIGNKLKSTDLILLTTPDFAKDLKIGLGKHQYKLKTVNHKNIVPMLKNHLKYPANILIEGRIPVSIKKFILNLK